MKIALTKGYNEYFEMLLEPETISDGISLGKILEFIENVDNEKSINYEYDNYLKDKPTLILKFNFIENNIGE
jgi:hypothetical protein